MKQVVFLYMVACLAVAGVSTTVMLAFENGSMSTQAEWIPPWGSDTNQG